MKKIKIKNQSFKLLLMAAVLAAFACKIFAAEEVSKVLASVDGEVITSQDLEEYCQLLNYSAKEKDKRPIDDMGFRKDSLLKLIDDRLILGKARTEKIDIPDGEIDSRIVSMRASFPSSEAFEQFMTDKSLSMQSLRVKIREQIIVSETIGKYVKAFISNSPQEIAQYYQDHKAQMVTKPVYTLLVAQGGDISKMEEISGVIKGNGGDEAIKRYPNLLVRAETDTDELKEELAAMARACKEGEHSIKTFDAKSYLVYVEKIVPSRQKDLIESTKDIDDLLWKQKYDEKLSQWLKELKEKAVILVYPPYGEARIIGEPAVSAAGSNQTAVSVVNATAVLPETPKLPANNTTSASAAIEPAINTVKNKTQEASVETSVQTSNGADIKAVNNGTIAVVANQTSVSLPEKPLLPQINPLTNQTEANQTTVGSGANH